MSGEIGIAVPIDLFSYGPYVAFGPGMMPADTEHLSLRGGDGPAAVLPDWCSGSCYANALRRGAVKMEEMTLMVRARGGVVLANAMLF